MKISLIISTLLMFSCDYSEKDATDKSFNSDEKSKLEFNLPEWIKGRWMNSCNYNSYNSSEFIEINFSKNRIQFIYGFKFYVTKPDFSLLTLSIKKNGKIIPHNLSACNLNFQKVKLIQ